MSEVDISSEGEPLTSAVSSGVAGGKRLPPSYKGCLMPATYSHDASYEHRRGFSSIWVSTRFRLWSLIVVWDLTDSADSVWPLIGVADWVSGVLASMMREVVMERAKYEWHDDSEPQERECLGSSGHAAWTITDSGADIPDRLLYLLHPSLRALILRLHAQLHAFANFVLSLDRPITHVNTSRALVQPHDARATVLAKENVRDLLGREGVDLLEWGKAIQTLGSAPGMLSLPPSNINVTFRMLMTSQARHPHQRQTCVKPSLASRVTRSNPQSNPCLALCPPPRLCSGQHRPSRRLHSTALPTSH